MIYCVAYNVFSNLFKSIIGAVTKANLFWSMHTVYNFCLEQYLAVILEEQSTTLSTVYQTDKMSYVNFCFRK